MNAMRFHNVLHCFLDHFYHHNNHKKKHTKKQKVAEWIILLSSSFVVVVVVCIIIFHMFGPWRFFLPSDFPPGGFFLEENSTGSD